MKFWDQKRRIDALEDRVAGLENLLAELITQGRISITIPDNVSRELTGGEVAANGDQSASPAWGRES